MTKKDGLQFTQLKPLDLTQDPSVPAHQGWFEDGPTDPNLKTELLLVERSVAEFYGPWRVSGALVKEPDRDPDWVEGWTDDYWTADAKDLWNYLVDKGGGNGITWEIAFLRIASSADASQIAAHYNDEHSKGNPFGLTKPETEPPPLIHDAIVKIEEPATTDPCENHVHVDMPFAAADPLTWRLAVELVRRHPEDLWIVRTFLFDGSYDCLSIRLLPNPLLSSGTIAINRNGSHVRVGWLGKVDEAPEDEPLLSWGSAYAEPDPRRWIRELEEISGLPTPGKVLPPSTPSSLALRWIAGFLSLHTGSRPRWTAWNDWSEVDFGQRPADFDVFSGAAQWLRTQGGGPATARVLFIGTYDDASRKPVFALSSDGHLWRADAPVIDLPQVYTAVGRSLTQLILATAANAVP
jgi:hypothetical protein